MKKAPRVFFTPAEDQWLRDNYATYDSVDELVAAFPDRPIDIIRGRAMRLGIARNKRAGARPDALPVMEWVPPEPGSDEPYVEACKRRGGFPYIFDLKGTPVVIKPFEMEAC